MYPLRNVLDKAVSSRSAYNIPWDLRTKFVRVANKVSNNNNNINNDIICTHVFALWV